MNSFSLAIKDVAEQTGLAAGTIRMWEQRYGFPEPARTPGGYRVYTRQDVITLKRVVAFRGRGLSVPAALERARAMDAATDRPSIFGAIASGDSPVRPQRLRRRTMLALSQAIEDEAMARAAGPIVVASFQAEANYRAVEHRYRRLARVADAVAVFARFPELRAERDDHPVEIPVEPADALGHEWAVIVDAPGFGACLVGWETSARAGGERVFEAIWTMDAAVVRQGIQVGAVLASRVSPALGGRIEALLVDRPLAVDAPASGLTALTNRIVGYMDAADG
ncbi:DICT sensory domain-containing protein [Candidatus Solirubrobacter pratensis]|uniref:DICT sensory domain-containing protein n=1 Tax=Candidatus Solirubrobacter pratensis TaxID=1298857 RepID=UPI0003FFEC05|nr:DICT sensory domain-containing protein [Candidatus Solirubrobacter pratensis]